MAKAVFAEVYEIVRLIPRGKVLTYGYISDMLEKRLSAQGVGWALNALSSSSSSSGSASGSSSSGSSSSSSSSASSCGGPYNSANVPWQRVVNVGGRFSTHKVRDGVDLSRLQRSLLIEEGVKFIIDPKDGQERIDMNECLWRPLS
jgi:methylated-DNA-protein-cysteine methyltransferase-like protein